MPPTPTFRPKTPPTPKILAITLAATAALTAQAQTHTTPPTARAWWTGPTAANPTTDPIPNWHDATNWTLTQNNQLLPNAVPDAATLNAPVDAFLENATVRLADSPVTLNRLLGLDAQFNLQNHLTLLEQIENTQLTLQTGGSLELSPNLQTPRLIVDVPDTNTDPRLSIAFKPRDLDSVPSFSSLQAEQALPYIEIANYSEAPLHLEPTRVPDASQASELWLKAAKLEGNLHIDTPIRVFSDDARSGIGVRFGQEVGDYKLFGEDSSRYGGTIDATVHIESSGEATLYSSYRVGDQGRFNVGGTLSLAYAFVVDEPDTGRSSLKLATQGVAGRHSLPVSIDAINNAGTNNRSVTIDVQTSISLSELGELKAKDFDVKITGKAGQTSYNGYFQFDEFAALDLQGQTVDQSIFSHSGGMDSGSRPVFHNGTFVQSVVEDFDRFSFWDATLEGDLKPRGPNLDLPSMTIRNGTLHPADYDIGEGREFPRTQPKWFTTLTLDNSTLAEGAALRVFDQIILRGDNQIDGQIQLGPGSIETGYLRVEGPAHVTGNGSIHLDAGDGFETEGSIRLTDDTTFGPGLQISIGGGGRGLWGQDVDLNIQGKLLLYDALHQRRKPQIIEVKSFHLDGELSVRDKTTAIRAEQAKIGSDATLAFEIREAQWPTSEFGDALLNFENTLDLHSPTLRLRWYDGRGIHPRADPVEFILIQAASITGSLGRIDLGEPHPTLAYELLQTDTTIEFRATLRGDTNRDGAVDQADLDLVLSNWGQAHATWATGDLSGDGSVEQADLDAVLTHWGSAAGPDLTHLPADAVPEPAAIAVVALVPWLSRRSRPRDRSNRAA